MQIYEYKSTFGWDSDNGIGEKLVQQIIDRVKTATCSFKILYKEQELNELYETKNKMVTVLDKQGQPKCNIRNIDVFETTFGNPDMRLVRGEGDGENIKKFQNDHRIAWNNMVEGIPLADDTILIVELFEFIEAVEQL